MAKGKKESTTSVGVVAPLTDYADGITSYYLAPHFGRSYPVRRDGDVISVILDDDAFLVEDDDTTKDPNEDPDKDPEEKPKTSRKAPTLMDVEVISNTVVYDAANNPTARIVFKIRNSSGEDIKAVNYRVSIA